jgi:dihydrofolate reductase
MRISIIVAVAANGVIGRANELPWHLTADLRRFKRLTMGHHLIMGRKTYESIGRPLPGRRMIVVSRRQPSLPSEVIVVGSLDDALEQASQAGEQEVFIAGGAQIYALAVPLADRVYLTRVHGEFPGDAVFPELEDSEWSEVDRKDQPADGEHPLGYSFLVLDRG